MKISKIILWNLIIFISALGLLEIVARNLFPEFKNRHSFNVENEELIHGKVLNKNFYKNR